ncbi:MAG: hypothetical protein U0798_02185 [Gemmataceae bacterium]
MTEVSGTVTFDGKAIDQGQILFRRTSGEQRGYETKITEGRYTIQCEPGEVSVVITAYRVVPGKFTTVNGPKEPVMEMYIPKQFNEESMLKASLDAKPKQEKDFDLTSK